MDGESPERLAAGQPAGPGESSTSTRRSPIRESRAQRSSRPRADTSSWSAVAPGQALFQIQARAAGSRRRTSSRSAGRGARCSTSTAIDAFQTKPVTGTQDWTKVEARVRHRGERRPPDQLPFRRLGQGHGHGLVRRHPARASFVPSRVKPRAAIDAAKTFAPISKYIYGQFIEHLGRCIYQGIWAEMLEDRKFYYPVGDKESPWKAIGDPRNVRMNPIVPYVGVHAPEIRLKRERRSGRHRPGKPGRRHRARDTRAASSSPPIPGRRAGSGHARSGGRARATGRPSIISDLEPDYRTVPLAFKAGGIERNRPARDHEQRERSLPRRNGLAHARRQRRRIPARGLEGPQRTRFARSIAGRAGISSAATTGKTDSATPTAGRRERTRPGSASSTTTSASTSFSEFLPAHRNRALYRRQQRPGQRDAGRRGSRIRQRRRRDADGASGARRTDTPSRGASSSGRSATKCTATGSSATCRSRITSRSTTASPRPCGPRTRRSSCRRRGGRALERGHAPACGRRGHGLHERAFLLRGAARAAWATSPRSRGRCGASPRPTANTGRRSPRSRARTSASPSTNGTTGTGRTSSASSGRAIF